MRTGKEGREDEEFGSKKTRSSSIHTVSVNTNININNDGKNNDKAKAIRSKHSVAEQRRRSKINERFQLLRDLIPNPDQKRDTASFLLEVIEYVQFLQEKVQKYEGSWSSEPTKLLPWRNSHWRVQSFVDHPQAIKYDSGPVSTFSGKLDVNNINISPSMITSALNPSEADAIRDVASKAVANKGMPLPDRGDNVLGQPVQRPVSEVQSIECLISNDTPNQQDNLTIEGGTINISSVYSHGLLNSLTQALQKTGLDLSHANISVQIDLGKRTNRRLTSSKEPQNSSAPATAMIRLQEPQNSSAPATTRLRGVSSGEDSDPVQKRLRK